jgi:hypothetical protein
VRGAPPSLTLESCFADSRQDYIVNVLPSPLACCFASLILSRSVLALGLVRATTTCVTVPGSIFGFLEFR